MSIPEIFATQRRGGVPRARNATCCPRAAAGLGRGARRRRLIDDANWRSSSSASCTVYLEVPFETIWERIQGSVPDRPLASGRSREEVEALFERRRPRYEQAVHRVDGDRPPEDVVADEVMKLWSA